MILDLKNFKTIKDEHIKFCNNIIKHGHCTFAKECDKCPFVYSNSLNNKSCVNNKYAMLDYVGKNQMLVDSATAFLELAKSYKEDKSRINKWNADKISLRDIKKILAFQNSFFLKEFCYTHATDELCEMIDSSDINILFFDDESIGNISIWCKWYFYEQSGDFDFTITEKEFEQLLTEYNEQLLQGGK